MFWRCLKSVRTVHFKWSVMKYWWCYQRGKWYISQKRTTCDEIAHSRSERSFIDQLFSQSDVINEGCSHLITGPNENQERKCFLVVLKNQWFWGTSHARGKWFNCVLPLNYSHQKTLFSACASYQRHLRDQVRGGPIPKKSHRLAKSTITRSQTRMIFQLH